MSLPMDALLLAAFLLLLWGCRPVRPLSALDGDGLTQERCLPVRGFFALVVMGHHVAQQTQDGRLFHVLLYCGIYAVSVFFFLSGYGLMHQVMTRPDYSRRFFLRRAIPIAALGLLALLLFIPVYALDGVLIGLPVLFRMLFAADPYLIILWYVLVILGFYAAFGLCLRLLRSHPGRLTAAVTVLWIIFVILGLQCGIGQWWFNTGHLLLVGMLWAENEERIMSAISSPVWYAAVLGLCAVGFLLLFTGFDRIYALYPTPVMRYGIQAAGCLLFTLGVVMTMYKLRFGNPILSALGRISFEIYVLQGVFLLLFHSAPLYIGNDFLYALAVTLCTVALAALIHKPYQSLSKRYRTWITKKLADT